MWQRMAYRHGHLAARQGREFARHIIPAVIKPARTLWNEFIAFLFFVFAVILGFRTATLVREFGNASASDSGALFRLVMMGFFTLLMLWFGLTSYLRARKISRS
jgi:hypothetical protein